MKTRMLMTALALVVITAAAGVAADTTVFKPHVPIMPRLDWAQAIAKEKNIPVIIDFYADW